MQAEPQPETKQGDATDQSAESSMWVDLGRAFAGALIFSISLLMTMETWWLGFYMDRSRLILLQAVIILLLTGLAYYRGFRESIGWRESVIDAFVGYAVGVITGTLFLLLLGVIQWGMPADEIVGKIALQATSSSIGALLARGQLGGREQRPEEEAGQSQRYWAEIFLMVAGAIFVGYTVAPTEEMVLIAYKMTPWHVLLTVAVSLVIMHVFVYEVDFKGQEQPPEDSTPWSVFLHYSIVGYFVVFLTSLYILWTFGRIDGVALASIVNYGVVLSLPGALGAAAARLIL